MKQDIKQTVRKVVIHAKRDYSLTVDSRDKIIERSPVPPDKDFLFLNLKDVFEKYKHLVKFEDMGHEPYPTSSTAKYNTMLSKNPKLGLLKSKFNCEIY